MIDWTLAWQITGVAFGFTFAILLFLAFMTKVISLILPRIPGGGETESRPANNSNGLAGE